MKVLGIVAEYNPFHNGHAYHILQSKEATGCDAVVCTMSGNFIQRGEPSIMNKFARTEIALKNGIDLVIELPHVFAMSSAEFFAFGAVKILDSIGIVDYISFGSEHGDIEALKHLADILTDEPELYKEELKKQLSLGQSFPASRQKALQKYLELESCGLQSLELSKPELLETSNNILAVEYLKALKKLGSSIKPYTLKRMSNQYNTINLTGSLSSATAIRNRILTNSAQNSTTKLTGGIKNTIPELSKSIIEAEFNNGRGPVTPYSFESIILAFLRQIGIEHLKNIPDVSEGLEYRIKTAAECSGDLDELLSNICTKRYTRTRIQRILFSMLTGITKSEMDMFMRFGGPQYARILGFNKTGRELLSGIKKNSSIPLITKLSDYKNSCNRLLSKMLEIEARSTDLYVLGYKNPAYRKAGHEFTQNIIVDK